MAGQRRDFQEEVKPLSCPSTNVRACLRRMNSWLGQCGYRRVGVRPLRIFLLISDSGERPLVIEATTVRDGRKPYGVTWGMKTLRTAGIGDSPLPLPQWAVRALFQEARKQGWTIFCPGGKTRGDL